MNINIKNIGKIECANIMLDGITVIAGENNTGKSTIGKTIFAVFSSLKDWNDNYLIKCSSSVEKFLLNESEKLETFCMKNTSAKKRRTNKARQLVKELSDDSDFITTIEDYKVSYQSSSDNEAYDYLKDKLKSFCINYVSLYQNHYYMRVVDDNKIFFENWIEHCIEGMYQNIELDETVLQGNVIRNSFEECFKSQYISEGCEQAIVNISGEMLNSEIKLKKAGIYISEPIRFKKAVYFIETPKLLDEIGKYRFIYEPKEEVQKIMIPNYFAERSHRPKTFEITLKIDDETNTENNTPELKQVLDMLRQEMGGYARYYAKEGIKFKDDSLKEPVVAQNVSTGLKAMAFLEYSLRIGAIQKDDILILDEPEINLHPEWQVSYARALVLLHKMYNITILITSHSPYFIRAIECLSDKYDVMDNLNVYLIDKDEEGRQHIDNVMESEYGMTELYDRLSAPLDSLQDEIDEKYNDGVK